MKRNIFKALALAAFVFAGMGSGSAQIEKGYDVQPLDPKIEEMCNNVLDLEIDDPDKSNKVFKQMIGKIRKDKDQLISVGEFFLNKQKYQVANMCAEQIYKLDPTYVPGLMFGGMVNKMRGFATNQDMYFGLAGQKYDEVLLQDSMNIAALRQNVTIYKKVNPLAAEQYLARVAAIAPDDYTVAKDLGDIRYDDQDYEKAAEYYKTFFDLAPAAEMEEKAAEQYVVALTTGGDYKKVAEVAYRLGDIFPKSLQLRRMRFIGDIFGDNIERAAESVKYITEGQFDAARYNYNDYSTAVAYFQQIENNPEAIKYGVLAIKADSTKTDMLRTLAVLYRNEGDYDNAINYYYRYLATIEEGKADYNYALGFTCYRASREEDKTAEDKARYAEVGVKALEAVISDEEASDAQKYMAAYYISQLKRAAEAPAEEMLASFEQIAKLIPNDTDDEDAKSYKEFAIKNILSHAVNTKNRELGIKYANEWKALQPENEDIQQYIDYFNHPDFGKE